MSQGMVQMKIGLVGLGRMGAAIAQRLTERGYEVVAWDRNPKAREAQAKRGLQIVDNPRAIADEADVVLSIITEDKGVREIFTGPDGFLSGEIQGKLFIEMSTLQPMTHRELAPMVSAKGARAWSIPRSWARSRPCARASCWRCLAARPPMSSARAACSTISRAASCISVPMAPAAP